MSRRRKRNSKRNKKKDKAKYAADKRTVAEHSVTEAFASAGTERTSLSTQDIIKEASKLQVRVHIRWMIRRDMPEVLAIEYWSFDFPWCEEEFLRVLRQRNCIGMVAELGERVVGFMIYELHKNKLNLLDFAVHPEFRRRTVGMQMHQKLAGKLSSHRRTQLVTILRETNLTGQIFWREIGWRATEVIREHYQDTGEDGFLMHYDYDESQTQPEGIPNFRRSI